MAFTAHSDPDTATERFDTAAVLSEKLDILADMIKASTHFVAFTGAGISTSAGIHDFRGPEGKWTREAQGLEPLSGVDTIRAVPTKTHMAIVELYRRGVLKYVISQNCDGLHRRSGLPASAISELHGNSNTEVCEDAKCGRAYFRDGRCSRAVRSRDHFTGRLCTACGSRLLEFTIDFGQNLPVEPLSRAQLHAEQADVHLALGTSLTVSPACDLPAASAAAGGKLVIVNLQRTPLDGQAALRIFARTDDVLVGVMQRLHVTIPPFVLRRRFTIGIAASAGERGDAKAAPNDASVGVERCAVHAVDPDAPAISVELLYGVDWLPVHSMAGAAVLPVVDTPASERRPLGAARVVALPRSRVRSNIGRSTWVADVPTAHAVGMGSDRLRPVLTFAGNYGEPPLQLDVAIPAAAGAVDVCVEYEPVVTQAWTLASLGAAPLAGGASDAEERYPDYGPSHRQYVIDGLLRASPKEVSQPLGLEEARQAVDALFLSKRRKAEAEAHALQGSSIV